MVAYYNENAPFAARWLETLAERGHVATGVVDARSIVDVRSGDLELATLGRLRAYGNAIVSELAATFIRATYGG